MPLETLNGTRNEGNYFIYAMDFSEVERVAAMTWSSKQFLMAVRQSTKVMSTYFSDAILKYIQRVYPPLLYHNGRL